MRNGDAREAALLDMTDLEKALPGSDSASTAGAIILRLDDIADEIAARLCDGMSPSDHSRAIVIRDALVAARDIVLGAPTVR